MPKDSSDFFNSGKKVSLDRISKIQSGSSIKGNLTTTDNLYLNDTIIGDIQVVKKVVLGEKAYVKGNISAENIIILGKMEGDLEIEEHILLGRNSYFQGKMTAKTIEIRDGALFSGQCIMRPSDGTETTIEEPFLNIDDISEDKTTDIKTEYDNKSFFLDIFQK